MMAKRRDVILASIYFSDEPQSKVRPCIVLSGEGHEPGFLMVAIITGAQDLHCILISKADMTCELASGSMARADMIVRISSSQKVRTIGQVAPAFYEHLVSKIIGLIR